MADLVKVVFNEEGKTNPCNAEADLESLQIQLAKPVTHVKDDREGREGVYYARRGTASQGAEQRDVLFLTANECFFENSKKLRCKKSTGPSDDWNQGTCWGGISGCESGHGVYWPFFLEAGGAHVAFRVRAKIAEGRGPMAFQLIVDGNVEAVLPVNESAEHYAMQGKMIFQEKGFHDVMLKQVQADGGPKPKPKDAILKYIKFITGKRAGIAVVRERWRPLAAHSTFLCSQVKNPCAWAMRIRKPPSLPCFSPMTSPFGYFGAILNADHTANGMNFSLWSFKRGAKAPPVHKLSRLLCIGNPEAEFGHFTHEGTGVKVRGWNPWDTNTSGDFVVGLRYREEPEFVFADGRVYTFFGYFWDEAENRWRIFGVGQKFFGKKELLKNGLFVKSFVEVPGPADRQRTNHTQYKVYYQGWVQHPKTKEWAQIDRLAPASVQAMQKAKKIKKRALRIASEEEDGGGGGKEEGDGSCAAEDGEEEEEDLKGLYFNQRWGCEGPDFTVGIGGLKQTSACGCAPKKIKLEEPAEELPEWMKQISALDEELPFPEVTAHRFSDGVLELDINIPPSRNKDGEEVPHSDVLVFGGAEDGLSIAEHWDKPAKVEGVQGGASTIRVELEEQPKFLRILVRDAVMQRWSAHTYACE